MPTRLPGLLLAREFSQTAQRGSELVSVPLFYGMAALLFPLAGATSLALLHEFAGSILWALVLLACLLQGAGTLQEDFEDGTLAQWISLGVPMVWVVLAKLLARICWIGGSLLLVAPLLALAVGVAPGQLPVLLAGFALGIPAVCMLGMLGHCLTLEVGRAGGTIPVLITLPLCLPVLVFGAGAVDLAGDGLDPGQPLRILLGILLIESALVPALMVWMLRALLRH